MIALLKENKWFFGPYLLLLLLTIPVLIVLSKGDFLLFLNKSHNSFADELFRFTNYMGEGLFYVIVLLILLFYRLKIFLLGLSILLQMAVVVQTLKRQVFEYMPRPSVFFEGVNDLYFVPEVKVYKKFSFPSGHTSTAFALFCFLALVTVDKKWGLLFLICAVFAGLARIYLAQHFLMDVFAGSLIGTTIAVLNYYVFNRTHWYQNRPVYNKSIIGLISRR